MPPFRPQCFHALSHLMRIVRTVVILALFSVWLPGAAAADTVFNEGFATDIGSSGVSSFQFTAGGDAFDVTFTGDGGGGSFAWDNGGSGPDGSSSIYAIANTGGGQTQRFRISKSDGKLWVFSGLSIANWGNTVTVSAHLSNGTTSTQTVSAGGTANLNFGTSVVDYVDVSATDLVLNFDNLSGTVITYPVVTSFLLSGSPAANSTTLTYTMTTNVGVQSVSADDFIVATSGTVSASAFSVTSISGTSYTVQLFGVSGEGSIRPNLSSGTDIRDLNYGLAVPAYTSATTQTVDTVAPTVSSVSVPSNATYIAGQSLNFTANFSESVTVTGTPRIALTVGSSTVYANYVSGSGTSAVVFRYTIQSGDTDTDGITVGALSLNGGTIRDSATNNATLTLNSVGSTVSVLVDAIAPSVTSVTVPSNGTYRAGETLSFTVSFSENLTVTGTDSTLGLTIGSTSRSATYASKTANSVTYTYTIQSGDLDSDGIAVGSINLGTTTIRDTAGNSATLTLNSIGATGSILVDAVAPSVSSVSVPSNGTYTTGQSLDFTVTFDENISVTGSDSALGLTIGSTVRSASYFASSGNAVSYRYTVQAGDEDSNGITVGSISLNTTTIRDSVGNDAILTLNSVGSTSSVLVDTIAPASPTISSPANGATLTSTTPPISGTADANVTVTVYVDSVAQGSTTANGAGNWSFTLPSALPQGTHSVSVNATDGAGLTSPYSATNSFTVDSTAPTVSSVSVPANGTYGTGDVLTFTVNFSEAVIVDTTGGTPRIALTLDTGGTVYADYVSGSGSATLMFQYTVQAGNQDATGITVGALSANGGNVVDAAGNAATLTLNNVGSTVFVQVDAVDAYVTSVAVPSNGTYGTGQNLDFTVSFNRAITVDTSGGTPRIALTVGTTTLYATYLSGSGSTALVFRLTLSSGLTDTDGITVGSLALNGGTLNDSAGHLAILTLNSVGSTIAVLVDTAGPTVTISSSLTSLKAGDTAQIDFQFSETPVGFSDADIGTVTGGTLGAVSVDGGDPTLYHATFSAGASYSGAVTMTVTAGSYTDSSGNSGAAGSLSGVTVDSVLPAVTLSSNQRQGGDFTAQATFNKTVTGFDLSDVTVTNATLSNLTGSGANYSFVVTPLTDDPVTLAVGAAVVTDTAGNDNTASALLTVTLVTLGPVEQAFLEREREIANLIDLHAKQTLRGSTRMTQRMVTQARSRLIDGRVAPDSGVDVDGTFDAADGTLSTNGTFSGQTTLGNGWTRYVLGDFDLTSGTGGLLTAMAHGRLTWEKRLSDRAIFGWFFGADVANTDVDASFQGTMQSGSFSLGVYGVQQLSASVYLDGFASAGLGMNRMDLSDGTLQLESDYKSKTYETGLSLTGVVPMNGYEMRPSLSVSYAAAVFGQVDLQGQVLGAIDSSLSIDAGKSSLTTLSIRNEFLLPLDGLTVAKSRSLLSITPELLCDSPEGGLDTEERCGGGLALDYTSHSDDGLRNLQAGLNVSKIGQDAVTGLRFSIEQRF